MHTIYVYITHNIYIRILYIARTKHNQHQSTDITRVYLTQMWKAYSVTGNVRVLTGTFRKPNEPAACIDETKKIRIDKQREEEREKDRKIDREREIDRQDNQLKRKWKKKTVEERLLEKESCIK